MKECSGKTLICGIVLLDVCHTVKCKSIVCDLVFSCRKTLELKARMFAFKSHIQFVTLITTESQLNVIFTSDVLHIMLLTNIWYDRE